VVAPERRLDYSALRSATMAVSAWLVDNGIPPGARVAVMQRDGPWAAVMLLGISRAHAAVPLNPNLAAEDYAFATGDFGVVAIVAEQDLPEVARLSTCTAPQLLFRPWSIPESDAPAPPPAAPDAPAFLLHTSGTTARPKKVLLTQERIFRSANAIADALQLGQHDRCLTGMPMFHVHGILNALASTLVSGGSFAHCGPFDTLRFYAQLAGLQPTWITAVPSMYHAIVARSELVPSGLQLRFLRSSSAPLSDVLAERLQHLFAVPVLSSYGMTEIDPIACVRFGDPAPRGAVGRPAGLEVRLAGADGREVAAGAMGDVWVRGGRVIDAYEAAAEVNTAAFRDGWFDTGDIACRDAEGWLFLSGRSKEIINRGGEKVAPLEIDAVLLRHPDVVEAAAFAVPDTAHGEEIAAAIVVRPGASIAEHELRAWAAQHLAWHKSPRYVQFVPSLPKGPTGKLLRGKLELSPDTGPTDAKPGHIGLVRDVWAEVLELDDVAPDARFADLGGSSHAAIEILIRLSERLGRSLPIDVLFDGDTPAALAAALERWARKQAR
jgi:acyl-CoA synthetase (AMP-forming)/AMP-acid ligase II/acyl carrier protein